MLRTVSRAHARQTLSETPFDGMSLRFTGHMSIVLRDPVSPCAVARLQGAQQKCFLMPVPHLHKHPGRNQDSALVIDKNSPTVTVDAASADAILY